MTVSFLLLLVAISASSALCPPQCTCYLDQRGRNSILCKDGGLIGPLSLFNMSHTTEVVHITAPEDNTNLLTMSPIFQAYKQLEEIHITRSNIPQLGQRFFWGLNKLDVLDLSQNNITQPLDHNFQGLLHLKELYLDDNRIHSLTSGTFRFLRELKVLSIQRNRLTELMPRIFYEVAQLKVLKLNGNYLKSLKAVVFEDIQELKTLECRACGLSKIDPQVYQLLSELNLLDLGDNKITILGGDDFKPLEKLRVLKLDGNRITTLKSSIFFNQIELKRLNLGRNQLQIIANDAFTNLDNLTELDLSHNKFEQRFQGETFLTTLGGNLETLIFNGNHLTIDALNQLFSDLDKLQSLDLEGCALTSLNLLQLPQTLTILNLAKNHLSTLPLSAIPPNLNELDLSNNRFRGLHEGLLSVLDRLNSLKLDSNPFSCDLCHIIPLLERVNRSSLGQLICASPYSAKGKKLSQLERSELGWCTVPNYNANDANFFLLGDNGRVGLIAAGSSVCLLFLTVFLIIIGAWMYSRRHAAKYYTHEDRLQAGGSGDLFFEQSQLFGEELSFKFPLEQKVAIATIDDELRKIGT